MGIHVRRDVQNVLLFFFLFLHVRFVHKSIRVGTKRHAQNLFRRFTRNEHETVMHDWINFSKVRSVVMRNQDLCNACAPCSGCLFLKTADRENTASQRELTSHGDVAVNGTSAERACE